MRQRHKAVGRFYSRRINALFEEWAELDDVLRPLLHRIEGDIHIASKSAGYRNHFTSPVLGCGDFLRSIKFTKPQDSRIRTVTVLYEGSGPRDSSMTSETITLNFITENGRAVIDGVRSVSRYDHSYIHDLDETKVTSLEEHIQGRCEMWKFWIEEINLWRRQNAGRSGL